MSNNPETHKEKDQQAIFVLRCDPSTKWTTHDFTWRYLVDDRSWGDELYFDEEIDDYQDNIDTYKLKELFASGTSSYEIRPVFNFLNEHKGLPIIYIECNKSYTDLPGWEK